MTSPTHDHAASPPPLRSWLGLSVLCLPTAVLALDMSVLYLALPHVSTALGANAAQELWILDIYPLLIAGLLVPMGALGDRTGQRRLLLGGAAAFAVISTVAAFSANAPMLIAARAALGAAGATLMPSALGLLNVMFPDPYRRRVAIALWSSAFMTGFAIGPLVGGALLDVFWWGAVFLPAVPATLLLAATGPVLLPEHRRADPGRFDLVSAALLFTGLLPLVHGLKNLANPGASGGAPLASVCIGLLALAAFAVRQYRLRDPLLDLRLLADRTVAAALLLLLWGPAVLGGLTLFVPQYLQLSQGLTALTAGALVAPAAAGLVVGALLAPAAARRIPAGTVIAAGLVVCCVGLLTVALGTTAGPGWVVAGLAVLYLGSGPFDALGTDLVVGAAPRGRAASAGAVSETATELGTGLGIALFGTLGSALYQRQVARALPSGLPDDVAAAARESISGAAATAAALEEEEALAVREAAEAAFTSGVQVVSLTGAALVALLALLALRLLRHA